MTFTIKDQILQFNFIFKFFLIHNIQTKTSNIVYAKGTTPLWSNSVQKICFFLRPQLSLKSKTNTNQQRIGLLDKCLFLISNMQAISHKFVKKFVAQRGAFFEVESLISSIQLSRILTFVYTMCFQKAKFAKVKGLQKLYPPLPTSIFSMHPNPVHRCDYDNNIMYAVNSCSTADPQPEVKKNCLELSEP